MKNQEFYRYTDTNGRTVIVDSLSSVPPAHRAGVERIAFSSASEPPSAAEPKLTDNIHLPSFAAGVACAVVLGFLLLSQRRGSNPLVRLAGFALAAALVLGLYFGWLRQSTGQGDSVLSTPSAVIDDARRAVEQMSRRNAEQDREIRKIQEEAK